MIIHRFVHRGLHFGPALHYYYHTSAAAAAHRRHHLHNISLFIMLNPCDAKSVSDFSPSRPELPRAMQILSKLKHTTKGGYMATRPQCEANARVLFSIYNIMTASSRRRRSRAQNEEEHFSPGGWWW